MLQALSTLSLKNTLLGEGDRVKKAQHGKMVFIVLDEAQVAIDDYSRAFLSKDGLTLRPILREMVRVEQSGSQLRYDRHGYRHGCHRRCCDVGHRLDESDV